MQRDDFGDILDPRDAPVLFFCSADWNIDVKVRLNYAIKIRFLNCFKYFIDSIDSISSSD